MSDSECLNFLKSELDKLHDALIHDDLERFREIRANISSQFETIKENIRRGAKSRIRREIEKQPHDPEDYDTSEDEQSKSHEDEQEVLEYVEEKSEEEFNERFPFPDFQDSLEELAELTGVPKEQAIKFIADFNTKYCS
jgi:vacuolar-type H+-ATPase subunit E/Vma4